MWNTTRERKIVIFCQTYWGAAAPLELSACALTLGVAAAASHTRKIMLRKNKYKEIWDFVDPFISL